MSIKKLIVFVILCVSHSLLAQQGFTITGGDFNSTNGSVSIAVGQTFYNINTGASASETQGVEQPCTIILTQPITQGVCVGANVIFTVITTGPSKYQWKKNGLNIGTNSNTLTLNNVALSDSGKYQVLITGLCGTIASNIVKLIIGNNVVPALNITTAATSIFSGLGATFTAAPSNVGSAPTYQWYQNSNPVGTNSATFYTNTLNNNDTIYCVLSGANNVCQTFSTAISNAIVMNVITITPPDTIPFRINNNLLDSFNNAGITASGYAGCNGGNADDDKFFIVIKPANYTSMNVILEGAANFDGVFEVLTGNSILNFVSLGCVNNLTNTLNQKEAKLFTGLPLAATTYLIRVFDYRTGNGSGSFKIGAHYYSNNVANNIPCVAINGSNNTAKIYGSPTLLTAYDNGIFGGSTINLTNEPPYGPNIAYWEGSTAFAPFALGAPIPICGASSVAPKRVWYTFTVPGMSDVDVVFRSKYGNTSNNTILEAVSSTGIPCPISYNPIKCSNNGTLILTAADMAPYLGQKLLIQLTEDGGTNSGINYMLSIQGVAPSISITNINTNGFTVNLPSTAPSNLTKYRIYYRVQGYFGLSYLDVPPGTLTYNITNLIGGTNYDIWVAYYNSINSNQIYYSPTVLASTLIGCSGTLPAPSVTLPVTGTTCTKATITWPTFAGAGTAFKYRFYYKKSSASGYSTLALNDTFINLTGLALNTNYDFYYKAICPTSVSLSSVASLYTNCGTPKKGTETPSNPIYVINGVTFTNPDFREIVLASENQVPEDGLWHYVDLSGASEPQEINAMVYPNPTRDFVNIEFESLVGSYASIELMSSDGKLLISKKVNTLSGLLNPKTNYLMIKERLEIDKFSAGMYYLKIHLQDQYITKPLIIRF